MRVSRLSGLEIVEEEKQFDKPFFVPGLGNCDLDKRDHDLIHALFYLKKDIYDGKTIQEYLADWHLIPSSFTCQGNEFYMNDEVVEDLLPYLALNSLEVDLEDQENQKVVEEYRAKHSDLSKQLINELFAVLLVSKTDRFEGSFEDLVTIYLATNPKDLLNCDNCCALAHRKNMKKSATSGQMLCRECALEEEQNDEGIQRKAFIATKMYQLILSVIILLGGIATGIVFILTANGEMNKYIFGGIFIALGFFVPSFILNESLVEKVLFGVYNSLRKLSANVSLTILNWFNEMAQTIAFWLFLIIGVFVIAVYIALGLLIPVLFSLSFVIGLVISIAISPILFFISLFKTIKAFKMDEEELFDDVDNALDSREYAVTKYNEDIDYKKNYSKNITRLILSVVPILLIVAGIIVVNFLNIDMSIKSWIYVGLVFAVILIPLFMTLIIGHHKLRVTVAPYLKLPKAFIALYPTTIKIIWSLGDSNPIARVISLIVELFFIPIGLLAFLMGFVLIFIAVILVLDIAALFSLPLSIYRAVKNFNYVSTKALFDFSDEEDEEDYE